MAAPTPAARVSESSTLPPLPAVQVTAPDSKPDVPDNGDLEKLSRHFASAPSSTVSPSSAIGDSSAASMHSESINNGSIIPLDSGSSNDQVKHKYGDMPSAASGVAPLTLLHLPEELLLEIGKLVMGELPVTKIKFASLSSSYVPSMIRVPYSHPATPAVINTSSALRRILQPYYFKEKLTIELNVEFCHMGRFDERATLHQYIKAIGPRALAQTSGTFQSFFGRVYKNQSTPEPLATGLINSNYEVVLGTAMKIKACHFKKCGKDCSWDKNDCRWSWPITFREVVAPQGVQQTGDNSVLDPKFYWWVRDRKSVARNK